MANAGLQIVVLERGILLVKGVQGDWRDLQEATPGYVTSVGPFGLAEALEWIELEWPDIHAVQAAAIAAFAAGPAEVMRLA